MEKFVVSFLHFFPNCRILVSLFPTPEAHAFVDFVITTPHGQTSMITQTLDIVFGFFPYTTQESRITRISGASKDKVLPNQYTHLIRCIIEMVIFIYTTSPYTNHIVIGILRIFHQLVIAFLGHVREQGIVRNQIRTFGKHGLVIDHKVERLAILIVFHDHLNGT